MCSMSLCPDDACVWVYCCLVASVMCSMSLCRDDVFVWVYCCLVASVMRSTTQCPDGVCVRCSVFGVRCSVFGVWCLLFCVRGSVFDVPLFVSVFVSMSRCHVVWCHVSCVRCPNVFMLSMSGALLSSGQCDMFDVPMSSWHLCPMFGV